MHRRLPALALAGAFMVISAGCAEPRSAEEMSAALLTVDELPGEWTVNLGESGADEGPLPESGILTDAQREVLPRVELCEGASNEASTAAQSFEWEVYRQLDQTVDDPIDPPTDREGHMVFVQESMMSDDPSDLAALFDEVIPGLESCLGDIPAGDEGPGTATAVEITSGGDEHIAVLTQIEEAGGRGMWYVYTALIRKGSVALSIMVADVFLGDLQPVIDLADFDAIVTTAVEKL